MTTKVATIVPQQGQAAASLLKVKVASALAKTNINLSLLAELVYDDVIVTGTKHKILILHEYEREFGSNNPDSIVTRKKVRNLITGPITPLLACCHPSENIIGFKN